MVEFEQNINLEKFCTIKIGGKAKRVYFPKSFEDIVYLLKKSQDENKRFIPVGIGSNIVFRDGVLDEIFVSTSKLKKLIISNDNKNFYINAEAGVSFKHIVNIVKKYNLEGFENLSGIPASIGGAVVMNAGAFGSEIFDILEEVLWIDKGGNLIRSKKEEINYGYRHTQFQNGGFVLGAKLKLKLSEKNIADIIKKHLLERNKKQPLNLPTAGSTFKNPKSYKAGYLLEKVGLKGYRIGNVAFSEKHANFTVNLGNATFKELIKLWEEAEKRVLKEFGIQLSREVQILP